MISDLSQELIDQMSLALDYDDLKNTLCVSRAFQAAAKRASGAFTSFAFRRHSLAERQVSLKKFAGRRFRFLRQVEVFTGFPPITESTTIACRETIDELRDKDEEFTRQIKMAWTTMHLVEVAYNGGMKKLQISIYAPTRFVQGGCLRPQTLFQLACSPFGSRGASKSAVYMRAQPLRHG
ncbi:hypothetical protein B5807_11354 [Epicoccum nigrum]|uniref:F-box domain-containing protein n=1 Tax=Epicoccum nigrum TaxID=105696 RepID=A0A1Y2LMA5_EPING|nr:hypothetical protein B5807_11354 [Epicoccum nigrum]